MVVANSFLPLHSSNKTDRQETDSNQALLTAYIILTNIHFINDTDHSLFMNIANYIYSC